MIQFMHKLTSPKYFYQFAGFMIPWLLFLCSALFCYGLIGGLYWAPVDYQQGDGYRIIYVHVPAALLSLCIYVFIAIAAAIGFIWKVKLANLIVKCSAPLGAWLTLLALVTGSLWGKPMWGTWWVWDARLTSELILLFLYLGIMTLHNSIPEVVQADRAAGLLAIIGCINIPVIHYSVYWWNTLHQGETLKIFGQSSIVSEMLYPLIAMILAFAIYFMIVLLMNVRAEILTREHKTQWVKALYE